LAVGLIFVVVAAALLLVQGWGNNAVPLVLATVGIVFIAVSWMVGKSQAKLRTEQKRAKN
jgi:hypothetical protein